MQVCAMGLFTSLKTVSFGKMLLSFWKMFLYLKKKQKTLRLQHIVPEIYPLLLGGVCVCIQSVIPQEPGRSGCLVGRCRP